jgi:hypothetical protein
MKTGPLLVAALPADQIDLDCTSKRFGSAPRP